MAELDKAFDAHSVANTEKLATLIKDGLTFGECVNTFAAAQTDEEKMTAKIARHTWTREGEIEVDENAIVSRGDDQGAYVMAWVWVYDPDKDEEDSTHDTSL